MAHKRVVIQEPLKDHLPEIVGYPRLAGPPVPLGTPFASSDSFCGFQNMCCAIVYRVHT